jgi:hypothetical protein
VSQSHADGIENNSVLEKTKTPPERGLRILLYKVETVGIEPTSAIAYERLLRA